MTIGRCALFMTAVVVVLLSAACGSSRAESGEWFIFHFTSEGVVQDPDAYATFGIRASGTYTLYMKTLNAISIQGLRRVPYDQADVKIAVHIPRLQHTEERRTITEAPDGRTILPRHVVQRMFTQTGSMTVTGIDGSEIATWPLSEQSHCHIAVSDLMKRRLRDVAQAVFPRPQYGSLRFAKDLDGSLAVMEQCIRDRQPDLIRTVLQRNVSVIENNYVSDVTGQALDGRGKADVRYNTGVLCALLGDVAAARRHLQKAEEYDSLYRRAVTAEATLETLRHMMRDEQP